MLPIGKRFCKKSNIKCKLHTSGWLAPKQVIYAGPTFVQHIHHTSLFRCSPRGFSATCLQQIQGSVVEGLSQTATSGSQCFFLSETLSCALS